ncbi:hypothetical protein D3C80_1681090 [compost metagenome]
MLDQFANHHLHRPAIGDDVVLDQRQHVVVFVDLQQCHAQQRTAREVERAMGFSVDERLDAGLDL